MDQTPPPNQTTGTGTAGTIVKWTGTTALGNSILSEVGALLTIAGTILVNGGTGGAPGYSFVGDPNTGIFSSSPDTLFFATNGLSRAQLDATGLQMNVPVVHSPGATGTPQVISTLATNTGLYWTTTTTMAYTTGGTTQLSFQSTDLLFSDGYNLSSGASTGTKIGTATTQKLGFFNATPVVQQNTTGTTVGFVGGAGSAVKDDSTFTGNLGATAYRISDIVRALKTLGLLAQ